MKLKRVWTRVRDAVTGRFTTRKAAEERPNETIEETVERTD